MPSKQANSNFWGTGTELTDLRSVLDPIEAREFLAGLSMKLFGDTYDYSFVEFRGLNLPITLKVKETGETFQVTPYWHLMSPDGRGKG